jgi:hypothetical protein
MTAAFKTLEEYPTLRIYSDGKIYDERIGRCRKQTKRRDGYMHLRAYNADGFRKTPMVHRLLAMAWIENPHNLSQVDHINHDRADNSLENLRWVSQSTNSRNQSLRSANTTGFQGIQHRPQYPKSWQARWYDEHGKERMKSFKHKGDAIEHRERMVKESYERPNAKSKDCNLCPEAKLFKKYMLIELSVAMKYNMIFLKSI